MSFIKLLTNILASAFLASVVAMAACGGSPPATTTAPQSVSTPPISPTTDSPTPATDDAAKPTPATTATGPTAKETLDWLIAKLNAGANLTEVEVKQRFTPQFLAKVPPARLIAVYEDIKKGLPPISITKSKGNAPLELNALLKTQQGPVRAMIGMTNESPRMIHTLLFQPASDDAPPTSYGEVVLALQKAGSDNSFFVAELKNGRCTPAHNHNVKTSLAIGSAFKLWVLHALDRKLAKSKATTWETKLAINDADKSLPSGVMQNEPAGKQFTLREFATQMISISDNSATDHLISYIGRKKVERALRSANHSAPAKNTPFMRTRELFALKLLATDAEIAAFRKANVRKKRKLLDDLRSRELKLNPSMEWNKPKMLDIEWFADGADLCNVMAALAKDGKYDPSSDVLRVLGTNPGVPFDKAQWKYMGFKGGSEPGVINLTFLAQRNDDRWFVVTMTVNDSTKALNEAAIANAAVGALKVLGAEKVEK